MPPVDRRTGPRLHARTRARQAPEHQRLRHDLGVGIPRVPRLEDVYRQQAGRCRCRNRPGETFGGVVHAEDPENRPPRDDASRSSDAVESVRDRNPDRIPLRKLAGHRSCVRVAEVKTHEPDAVVTRVAHTGERTGRATLPVRPRPLHRRCRATAAGRSGSPRLCTRRGRVPRAHIQTREPQSTSSFRERSVPPAVPRSNRAIGREHPVEALLLSRRPIRSPGSD
jgi:hypothetical protein